MWSDGVFRPLYCPACGGDQLVTVRQGGKTNPVHCYSSDCPRPTAAAEILSDRETQHAVTFGETGFTIRHPLIERLDDALLECDLHKVCQRMDSPPPAGLGRYRAERQATDEVSWMFQKILVPTAEATS